MNKDASRLRFIGEGVLPWLILVILLYFTYARFFQWPYSGFRHNANGEIIQLFIDPADPESSLEIGDRLIMVGSISWSAFVTDPMQTLFDGVTAGTIVPLVIEREGQELTIAWPFPGPTTNEISERLNNEWWLSYAFWVAGMAAMLLIRPRDIRWLLLQLSIHLTAVWLLTGGLAETHVSYCVPFFRSAVWLTSLVYLHFHWEYPRPLARLPVPVFWVLYLFIIAFGVGEWLDLVPENLYIIIFFIALIGSGLILLGRLLFRPSQRANLKFLFGGLLIATVPFLGVLVTRILGIDIPLFLAGGSILALPAIPGAYFISVYQSQLGNLETRVRRLIRLYLAAVFIVTFLIIIMAMFIPDTPLATTTRLTGVTSLFLVVVLAVISFAPFLSLATLADAYGFAPGSRGGMMRFRANKLLGPYLFFVIIGAVLTLLSLLVNASFNLSGLVFLMGTSMALIGGIVTLRAYAPFQRFVESRLLGISLPPDDLLQQFASRIPTSLERQSLIQLLTAELLPSLLIRQSALIHVQTNSAGTKNLNVFYRQGIETADLPQIEDVATLRKEANRYRIASDKKDELIYPWAYVIFPLFVGQELIGFWMLGHRDPDDLYSRAEIETLGLLADQTAVALANIYQAETLNLVYQANIERQEAERARLARALHDSVLHQIGKLRLHLDETAVTPQFEETYQTLKSGIRHEISGLRPAALIYGLAMSLEEYVDSLNRQSETADYSLVVELSLQTQAGLRYPLEVEQHLFRIVQEAIKNARRHAKARTILVQAQLQPNTLSLAIEDDGVGFNERADLDLRTLLSEKHFGLISMYERAKIIGAELTISSRPQSGTRVGVTWSNQSPSNPAG